MRGVTPIPETGANHRDNRMSDPAQNPCLAIWVKLPRYGREGAVEARPVPAKTRPGPSMAQGLSGEAMKGNTTTKVIPRVDESKSTNNRRDDRTQENSQIPTR